MCVRESQRPPPPAPAADAAAAARSHNPLARMARCSRRAGRLPARTIDARTRIAHCFFLSHLEQTSRSQPFKTSYMTVFVKKKLFSIFEFLRLCQTDSELRQIDFKVFSFYFEKKITYQVVRKQGSKAITSDQMLLDYFYR